MVQHLEPTNALTFTVMKKETSIIFRPTSTFKTIRNAMASKSRNLWVSTLSYEILYVLMSENLF